MKHKKAFYQSLSLPAGFSWGFYDNVKNLHSFVAKTPLGIWPTTGFTEVRCRESEITDGSLELMIKMEVTR